VPADVIHLISLNAEKFGKVQALTSRPRK